MAYKLLILVAVIAAARAGVVGPVGYAGYGGYGGYAGYAAPVAKYAAPYAKAVVADDYDPNPQYSYAYDIQDGLTGDSKSQHETRSGDVVQGSYSLVEADGHRRIVDYTADPHNGFNAVVRREPIGKVIAAPVAKIAAPIAYAAPVAKYGYPAYH